VTEQEFDQNFAGVTGRTDNADFHSCERENCICARGRVKSQTVIQENSPRVSARAAV
jgi:hypothetical protein